MLEVRRWSWPARIAVIAGVAFVAVLLLDGTRWVETRLGDTGVLVSGTHAALDCVRDGTLSGCGHVAGTDTSTVGAFALAQYVLAAPLVALDLGDATVERGLAWTSAAAVAAMVVLALTIGRRVLGHRWAVVLVLALVSGPMVLYGLIPFGEALATFLCFAFALAACTRRTRWIVITIFLACLTKETAAPFLLAIGVVCARDDDHDGWLPPLRILGPMVGGAIAAVVVNAGFNLFRFGTVSNLTYSAPYTRVPGVVIKAKLAVADWLAPNVGVLFFWTVTAIVLAGVLVAGIVELVRRPRQLRGWAPALAVVAITAAFTGVLASWWSTFGWLAWGPRLTLPLLPALVVAALRAAPGPLDAGLRWLVGSTARAVVTGAALAVLAVGQAGVVWNQAAIALPTVPSESCPVLKAPWETTPDYFYGCGLDAAWRTSPLALWEAARHGPRTQQLAEVLQVLTIAGLVAWLAADVRRHDRHRVVLTRSFGVGDTPGTSVGESGRLRA
jgi:hypothetical protein